MPSKLPWSFVGYSAFASISVQHCPHSLYRPQFSSFLVLLVPSRYPSTNTFEYLRKSSNPPNFPAWSRLYLWIPTEIMSKSAKIGKGYVECNVSAKKGTSLGVAHFCHKAWIRKRSTTSLHPSSKKKQTNKKQAASRLVCLYPAACDVQNLLQLSHHWKRESTRKQSHFVSNTNIIWSFCRLRTTNCLKLYSDMFRSLPHPWPKGEDLQAIRQFLHPVGLSTGWNRSDVSSRIESFVGHVSDDKKWQKLESTESESHSSSRLRIWTSARADTFFVAGACFCYLTPSHLTRSYGTPTPSLVESWSCEKNPWPPHPFPHPQKPVFAAVASADRKTNFPCHLLGESHSGPWHPRPSNKMNKYMNNEYINNE